MVVELISVGTEILLGNIVNTNAAYLAEKCALLGCSLYHQTVVGDNEERMEEAIRQAIERADIVILTGGLGPTKDDLTKEVTAKVFGRKLYMDEHSKARIQDYFEKIKSKKVTENNWKQALVPEGAIVIDNLNGTAPGLILEDKERGKAAILIPGPPNEMKPMFEHDIAPYLNKKQPEGIYSHMVKVCGIGESRAETMVADLMDAQTNPTLAPYAKTGEVHFRVTARACSEEAAEKLMEPMIEEMKKRKLCMIFLLCLALMTLVAGCRSKKETNDQGNQKGTAIYYTNNDVTKLIMKKENVKLEGNQQQKVKILLKKLQQTPKSDKIRSVIPKRIMINGVSVNTNIVEIDFSTGYKRISENRDLICRAGIVYTLTQLKDINYVSFSISGEPMLDTDGTAIGALGRDSFVFGKLPMK